MINIFGLFITVFMYKLVEYCKKYKLISKLPPLLISGILIILVLKIFHIDFKYYNHSASFLTFLLMPATISLGYPLYKNFDVLLKYKRVIYAGFIMATLIALCTTYIIAKLCNTELSVLLSMLPKSVTAPIAIEISKTLGGVPEITACMVVLTGVFGAILGHKILEIIKIKSDIAIGLSIGASSHVLGTSSCVETGREKQIAMSSLALVMVGILTAILAPMFIKFVG